MCKKIVFCLMGLMIQSSALAMIDLELTQGVARSVPVAMSLFDGDQPTLLGHQNLTQVVINDLQNSGQIRVVSKDAGAAEDAATVAKNADYTVAGAIHCLLSRCTVTASLRLLQSADAAKAWSLIFSRQYSAAQTDLRSLAHTISDDIYQKITGIKGVFNTKIAYVLKMTRSASDTQYRLMVSDQDGYHPTVLLQSDQPIMSPAWSRDGSRLAYVSFQGGRSGIYIYNFADQKQARISDAPGINGAPAFSPSGDRLALVLSTSGNPKIHLLDLATQKTQALTHGWSIDTEPVFMPDGQSLIFTSNRDGSPQLYQYFLKDEQINRLTYTGSYNARADLTPDGKAMVYMHRQADAYGIARTDFSTGQVNVLINHGQDESPSVAPNGHMVVYATTYAGRGVLGQVSIDGRVHLRLPAQEGSVQEPAWSPYIAQNRVTIKEQ